MSILRVCLSILLCLASVDAMAGVITNGDFSSAVDLEGFTATGSVSEPTGEFAQITTAGSLEQGLTIPAGSSSLSFDFAFSTEATATTASFFPDSFAVSVLTDPDGEFLDILVVDVFGAVPDPSDGFEGLFGAEEIVVSYDSSVGIAGFQGFAGGTDVFGRISLDLPSVVLGESATVFFELFDSDGFNSIAAIDNVEVTTGSVIPEPVSASIWLVLVAGLCARRKRRA